jgi:hypothetical protein
MNLYTVTIAGADDLVDPKDLARLSKQYPFVEWAILLSKSKQGGPRYPSYQWIESLSEFSDLLRLSGHLCGGWVEDIINGRLSFRARFYNIWKKLARIQINLHGINVPMTNNFLDAMSIIHNKQLILQTKSPENVLLKSAIDANINVAPLFDMSHGTGYLPDAWPEYNLSKCGYAGGLNPNNIIEQINKIAKISVDKKIWVDMESGVRTNNRFDIDKAEKILELVEEYVSQDCRAASYLETPLAKKRVSDSLNPPPPI